MIRSMQDQLIGIVEDYRKSGEAWPAPKKDIAIWAVRNDRYEMQEEAVVESLSRRLGDAMRAEHHVDPDGNEIRTYGAFLQVIDGKGEPKQQAFWVDIRDATPEEYRASIRMRLQHGAATDLRRLCVDVHSWNKNYRKPDEPEIDLRGQLDFTGIWDETAKLEETVSV